VKQFFASVVFPVCRAPVKTIILPIADLFVLIILFFKKRDFIMWRKILNGVYNITQ
jgi:hypothetical protein